VEYRYSETSRELRIEEILYTGNDDVTPVLEPYNKIKFYYEDREDQNETFVSGSTVRQNSILTRIQITGEYDKIFKTYKFIYGYDLSGSYSGGINSYLNEIVEYGSDGEQLNATRFQYGSGEQNQLQTYVQNDLNTIIEPENFYGDFNGDGLTDVIAPEYGGLDIGQKYYNAYNLYLNQSGDRSSTSKFQFNKRVPLPSQQFTIFIGNQYTIFGPSALYTTTTTGVTGFFASDANGDGKDDLFLIDYDTENTGDSDPSNDEIVLKNIEIHYDLDASPQKELVLPAPNSEIDPGRPYFFPGDFDGDSRVDYVIVSKQRDADMYDAYISYPFATGVNILLDISNVTGLPQDIWKNFEEIYVIDFDGGGDNELLIRDEDTYYVLSTDNNVPTLLWKTTNNINKDDKVTFGDFNGDGLTDILVKNASNDVWRIKYSSGVGYSFGETPFGSWLPSFASTEHIRIADFDGNGLQDILYVVGQDPPGGPNDYEVDLNYYFSKGNNEFVFKEELVGYNGNDGGDPTEIDDILRKFTPVYMDADNAADICGEVAHPDFIPINPDPLHIFYTDVGGKEDLLSKVANGFNQTTEFTYKSTSAGGDFYTRGSNSSYALNDLQIPLMAVSSASMSDGIDGQNITNYTYEAGRLHRIGRGFLGFTKVSAENNVSGYTSTSEYEFDTGIGDINNPRKRRYTTALKEQKVMLTSDGSLISEVKNTNEFIDQTNGDEDRYWVRVMESESTDHINDITTTTDYTYDTDGNVMEEFVDIGGIETIKTKNAIISQVGCSPYKNFNSRTEITKTRLSDSPHENAIVRAYNGEGRVVNETIYSSEEKSVSTNYTYNGYGNVTRTIVSPNDVDAQAGRIWDYKY
ncbi:MAG: toxin TcdB middle/N-terminal domain-containing protein, partial [Bacteroidota bacterium]